MCAFVCFIFFASFKSLFLFFFFWVELQGNIYRLLSQFSTKIVFRRKFVDFQWFKIIFVLILLFTLRLSSVEFSKLTHTKIINGKVFSRSFSDKLLMNSISCHNERYDVDQQHTFYAIKLMKCEFFFKKKQNNLQ